MREIKFRAWDKENKVILEALKLNPVVEEIILAVSVFYLDDLLSVLGERFELMQFTGFLDKNGKEIYEGDIVKAEGGNNNLVFWWKEKGLWGIDERDIPYDYLFEFNKDFEIIGNVHENPELLKS